ncbi:MAG: hypothetical protein K9N51_05600 [Candidatus Pacebacteria bacterium]|nr:hypothetical protein [Candidatus Paceibacterota bacterium]
MKRWLKWLCVAAVLCGVLVSVLYVVVSRPAFVKGVLLPRIAAKTGGELTAEGVAFSPLSKITLTNLTFAQPANGVHLEASRVSCSYSLFSFMLGNVRIDSVAINDGLLTYRTVREGVPVSLDIDNVEIMAEHIANGQTADISLRGDVRGGRGNEFVLKTGRLKAAFTIDMTAALDPEQVRGTITLDNLAGHVGEVDLTDISTRLEVDGGMTGPQWNVSSCNLSILRSADELSRLHMSGKGHTDPLSADVNLSIDPVTSDGLTIVGALLGDYDFGNTQGAYHGHLTFTQGQEVKAEGELNVQNFTLASEARNLTPLPPANLHLTHSISADTKAKKYTIEDIQVDISQNGRQVIQCKLTQPAVIQAKDSQRREAGAEPAELTVTINTLDLRLLNTFRTPETRWQLNRGMLNGNATARISGNGERITISGEIKTENATATINGREFGSITLIQGIQGTITELEQFQLKPSTTAITVNGKQAVELRQAGTYDLMSKQGSYTLVLSQLTHDLFKAVPRELLKGLVIDTFSANGNLQVTMGGLDKATAIRGQLVIPEAIIIDPEIGVSPSTMVNTDFHIVKTGGLFDIKTFDISGNSRSEQIIHLSATGRVALPPDTQPTTVKLRSDTMDVEAVAGMGYKLADLFAEKRKAEDEEKPEAKAEEPERALPEGLDLTVNLNLKDWQYRSMNMSEALGTLLVQNGTVYARPLDLTINGAPVHLEGKIGVDTADRQYDLAVSVQALDIDPILASFGPPALRQQIDAKLSSLQATLKGQGFGAADLQRTMAGDVNAELDLLSIKKIEALDEAATKWKLPELREIFFNKGTLRTQLDAGTADIRELTMTGDNLQVTGDGAVDLHTGWDIVLSFAVGGELRERLMGQGYGELLDAKPGQVSHSTIPVSLAVTGPLTNPTQKPRITAGVRELLLNRGTTAVRSAVDSAIKGEKIDAESLLKGLLKGTPKDSEGKSVEPQPESQEKAPPQGSTDTTKRDKSSTEEEVLDAINVLFGPSEKQTPKANAEEQDTPAK